MFALRVGNSALYNLETDEYIATANGCLRAILVRYYEGQTKPNRKSKFTFAVGTLCENLVNAELIENFENVQCDVPMRENITDLTEVVGHCDNLVFNGIQEEIYEQKSISSITSFKKIIEKGQYKHENVYQLLNYMLIKEHTVGNLLYTSMLWPGIAGKSIGDQRTFVVRISDDGSVTVDDKPYPYNVKMVLGHRIKAAECLENKKIWPCRPTSLDTFFNCCQGCAWQPACDRFAFSRDPEDFWNQVKMTINILGKQEELHKFT